MVARFLYHPSWKLMIVKSCYMVVLYIGICLNGEVPRFTFLLRYSDKDKIQEHEVGFLWHYSKGLKSLWFNCYEEHLLLSMAYAARLSRKIMQVSCCNSSHSAGTNFLSRKSWRTLHVSCGIDDLEKMISYM